VTKEERRIYMRAWTAKNSKLIGSRYRAGVKWANIKTRLKHDASYKGVELRIAREDFVQWFMPKDFDNASVDRINPKGHYEFSNMQVISWSENCSKDKLTFTATHGTCRKCKQQKTLVEFVKMKNVKNGRGTICSLCNRVECR
jgi:hypothetical protein